MKYVLINKITAKPWKRQEVVDIMLEAGKPFDSNPACLLYLVSTARDDPNVIWVQDVWADQISHETAMKTDKMMQYIKNAAPLLERMPEQFQVDPVGGKSEF